MSKMIAFDSGIEKTGWAIMEKSNANEAKLLESGCIFTSKTLTHANRLLSIKNQTKEIIGKYDIQYAVLEKLFFNTNTTTAMAVAQAQGVVIATLAESGIEVEFVTPLFVKQTITGYGRADKKQVSQMVKILLKIEKMPKMDDIVDAIAIGITYCRIKPVI